MKPYLFLVRGVPGSGKTTLAKRLCAAFVDAAHYEADMWMLNERGEYAYDRARLNDVHRLCLQHAEGAMSARVPCVVVSNTFVKLWQMVPYREAAKRHGYQVVTLNCEGDFGSVHSVPETTMHKMRSEWEAA